MGKIETLDLDAARIKLRAAGVGMDKATIADGIEQGVFSFGIRSAGCEATPQSAK